MVIHGQIVMMRDENWFEIYDYDGNVWYRKLTCIRMMI